MTEHTISDVHKQMRNLRDAIDRLEQQLRLETERRLGLDPVEMVARAMAERACWNWDADWPEPEENYGESKEPWREMARVAIRVLAGGGVAPWSDPAWKFSPSNPSAEHPKP